MKNRNAIGNIRMRKTLTLTAISILFSTAAFGIASASPSPGFQGTWKCTGSWNSSASIQIRGNTVTYRGEGGFRITGPLTGNGNTASVKYNVGRRADNFQLTADGKLNSSGSHRWQGCTK